jgi:hypothetical protein
MGGAPIKPTERRNAATKRMRVRLNAMEKGQLAGPRIGNSSNQKFAFLTNNAGERVQEECRKDAETTPLMNTQVSASAAFCGGPLSISSCGYVFFSSLF